MINPVDAITLAYTKVRARKVRTIVTIMIAGLLFGALLGVVFITSGIIKSIENFGQEGLGERYLVATYISGDGADSSSLLYDANVIKRVEELRLERISEKTAEAKRLGIEYLPEQEDTSFIETYEGEKSIRFDMAESPIVQQAIREHIGATPNKPDITTYTKDYDVKAYPTLRTLSPQSGAITEMEGGKEVALAPQTDAKKTDLNALNEFSENKQLRLTDSSITDAFMTSTFDPSSGKIPVLLPFNQVERRLGLAPLDTKVSREEQLQRINEVHKRASELTIDLCYRNTTSEMLLSEALQTKKDIAKNAKNTDYQKPSLIYKIPEETSCGALVAETDTRTEDEKKLTENRLAFDKKYNNYLEPEQHKLSLQVVGVTPASIYERAQQPTIASAVLMMFSPSIDNFWSVPTQLLAQLPAEQRPDAIFKPSETDITNHDTKLVEFNTLESARKFLSDYSCTFTCNSVFAMPFGSSSLLVADAQHWVGQILFWAVVVVSVIAGIILAGIIGRTIADGRRETAVFRAIGARRIDIVGIYITYTIMLSGIIIAFAAALGITLAMGVDSWLSAEATNTARITFGANDPNRTFHFIWFDSIYTIVIPLVIVALSLIAASIPLARNVKRNPIKDMRDE